MTFKAYLVDTGYVIIGLLILHLMNPFDMAHIFGYLLIVIFALSQQNRIVANLDFDFVLLLLFGITYSLFDSLGENAGFQYLMMQAIFPAFFYIVGKILIRKELTHKNVLILILLLIFSLAITSLISVIGDLARGGFTQTGRLIKNFWTGNGTKATQFANYLIYCMALPPILITMRKNYKLIYLLLFILLYLTALICIFRLGSRTAFFIAIITFLIGFLLLFSQQNIIESVKLTLALAIIGFIILYFFPINVESEYFSTLGHRLQSENTSSASSAGGRTVLWTETLKNFYKYPLGGWNARRHAHNLWLDIGRVAGVIPLIFLIFFNIKNVFNIRSLYQLPKTKNSLGVNMMFTLFSLSALISFFVEPILEGAFFAFTFYCLLQGTLKGYIDNFKKPKA